MLLASNVMAVLHDGGCIRWLNHHPSMATVVNRNNHKVQLLHGTVVREMLDQHMIELRSKGQHFETYVIAKELTNG